MFNKKYATPNGLQLALIATSGAAYIIGFLQILSVAAGAGPQFVPVLMAQAFPALLLGLAFFLNPRKKLTQTQRMFEATVITIIGVAGLGALTQLVTYVANAGANLSYSSYFAYELGVMIVLLVGFAGALWFLGRTKRWK